MEIVSNIRANIIKEIGCGEGRNSRVFLANDPQLNGNIAIKEIPISQFSDPSDYFTEAQMLYSNSCPHVVPVQYACSDTEYVRIAMPFFEHGSLHRYIDSKPLTVRKTILLADQFLTGVHHVHMNGFIHYDIKPSNILIHNDGSAVLSDFGQSRPTDYLGVAEIPPLYMKHIAPEVFINSKTTNLTDLYQVGLTLYRMCNGNSLFNSQLPSNKPDLQELVLTGRFPDRNKFLQHIPSRLKRIIRKLLEVNPTDRYQSIIDLKNDLGQVNTLLDWEYNVRPTGILWVMKNFSHQYEIYLNQSSQKTFCIEGFTIRLCDGMKRKRNDWCGGPFRTLKQVELGIARIFREMEATK